MDKYLLEHFITRPGAYKPTYYGSTRGGLVYSNYSLCPSIGPETKLTVQSVICNLNMVDPGHFSST